MTFTIDDSGGTGRAVSNDVLSANFSIPSGVQDVTGVNSSGMERLLLLADMQVTITAAFNDAATTGYHTVMANFRTLAASQVGRTTTIVHSGQTLAEEILFSDYVMTRNADGSLTVQSPGAAADGTVPSWA